LQEELEFLIALIFRTGELEGFEEWEGGARRARGAQKMAATIVAGGRRIWRLGGGRRFCSKWGTVGARRDFWRERGGKVNSWPLSFEGREEGGGGLGGSDLLGGVTLSGGAASVTNQ